MAYRTGEGSKEDVLGERIKVSFCCKARLGAQVAFAAAKTHTAHLQSCVVKWEQADLCASRDLTLTLITMS
jgi:hypothetical protein